MHSGCHTVADARHRCVAVQHLCLCCCSAAIAAATSLLRPARGPARRGSSASCRLAVRRMQQQANGSAVGERTDLRPTGTGQQPEQSVAGASVSAHGRSRHTADISSATCSRSSGRRRVRDDGVGRRRADSDDAGEQQRRATTDVVVARRHLGSCQLVERSGTGLPVRRQYTRHVCWLVHSITMFVVT